MARRLSAGTLRALLLEIARSGRGEHVLAVGGASEAHLLRQQLLRGRAAPAAVRLGGPEGAAAYVHVLAGDRRCWGYRGIAIPYVPATDVVWVGAGQTFPLEAIRANARGSVGGARRTARCVRPAAPKARG